MRPCHLLCLAVMQLIASAESHPMLHAIAKVPRQQPLLFGVAVTSAKTAAADVLTQKVVLRREWAALDLARVSVFALYGALYLGGVQYWLFCRVYPRLLPLASRFAALPFGAKIRDTRGFMSVLAQVGLDQGLHWPLSAIPCFYYFKGLGEGRAARGERRRTAPALAERRPGLLGILAACGRAQLRPPAAPHASALRRSGQFCVHCLRELSPRRSPR